MAGVIFAFSSVMVGIRGNYADAGGKVPLVKIVIKGRNEWQGPHPIAEGAYNVDYIADEAYEITPLHQGFADAINQALTPGLISGK